MTEDMFYLVILFMGTLTIGSSTWTRDERVSRALLVGGAIYTVFALFVLYPALGGK